MRAKLQVQVGEPSSPEQATHQVARALLTSLPRQRPVTLGLLALGPHAGLTPTPWAIDGVLEALLEDGRGPSNLLTLGDSETAETALRRAGRLSLDGRSPLAGVDGRELLVRPSLDRKLALEVLDRERPMSAPRELVGTSLVLLCPLLLHTIARGRGHGRGRGRGLSHGPGLGARPSSNWAGPLGLAAAAVARAWGFGKPCARWSGPRVGLRPRDPDDEDAAIAAGWALLTAVFSSVSLIIDGTWAGALEASAGGEPARLRGELVDTERSLGLADLTRLDEHALEGVDLWLARALGVERGGQGRSGAPELAASPGRWPQLELGSPTHTTGAGPKRLADRAIAGFRSQSQRLHAKPGRPALPARVPGRFASLWTQRWFGPELDRLHAKPSRPAQRAP